LPTARTLVEIARAEDAQMLFFELVVQKLRPLLGETAESLRAHHSHLE
jgi:hypothetical protein